MSVSPVSGGRGGAIVSHSNITARIMAGRALRMSNEEALASARRLEAVGRLAGGVAHDFNNLLAVIAGNLELAEDGDVDEPTRQLIRRARDAAEKGRDLNSRLLSLARKRALAPQYLSVNWRVEETAKLLISSLGEHITVSMELAADLWMTLADPGEIDSALLNTAANALDAMPKGGRIAIATSNVTLDAPSAATLHAAALPGDYVRLSIADDGAGMPQAIHHELPKALAPSSHLSRTFLWVIPPLFLGAVQCDPSRPPSPKKAQPAAPMAWAPRHSCSKSSNERPGGQLMTLESGASICR